MIAAAARKEGAKPWVIFTIDVSSFPRDTWKLLETST
jgi:hypothetical protein